ncbi:hypothetical protein B0H13DRAFT_1663839, partial [Mycena leptocephala]
AKLWMVYISGAEKYDKALVESWKSDMEGLLIFILTSFPQAGLFSAVLTTFIIESYKMLNSDSGDLTVELLSRISQQLEASANGTTFNIPPSSPFAPQKASIVCNALWFFALGLSLACALIATLVEQWAREFLHRADMRSAPVIHARIFSYLYYGLKRFHMHTVVEIIPLLLHASLFFFGGLVAFLIPVNIIMTVIAVALLSIVAAVYIAFTLLPLWYLDCPYRTPLSVSIWQLLQIFKTIWLHRSTAVWWPLYSVRHRSSDSETGDAATVKEEGGSHLPRDAAIESDACNKSRLPKKKTMVEAIFRAAMDPHERPQRHRVALVWTMKSLADEAELEPFVEALPDLLWGLMAHATHTKSTSYI